MWKLVLAGTRLCGFTGVALSGERCCPDFMSYRWASPEKRPGCWLSIGKTDRQTDKVGPMDTLSDYCALKCENVFRFNLLMSQCPSEPQNLSKTKHFGEEWSEERANEGKNGSRQTKIVVVFFFFLDFLWESECCCSDSPEDTEEVLLSKSPTDSLWPVQLQVSMVIRGMLFDRPGWEAAVMLAV